MDISIAPKIYDYLKRCDVPVSRNQIFKKAREQEYTKDQVWDAIREIKEDRHTYIDVGIWYDSEKRQEYFQWYKLGKKEKRALQEDLIWFDNL